MQTTQDQDKAGTGICRGWIDEIVKWHAMPHGEERDCWPQENVLSVEFRSGWSNPGEWECDGGECLILLAFGGPSVRVFGELDSKGIIVSPRIQGNDWGTPWQDAQLTPDESEALQAFAESFNGLTP